MLRAAAKIKTEHELEESCHTADVHYVPPTVDEKANACRKRRQTMHRALRAAGDVATKIKTEHALKESCRIDDVTYDPPTVDEDANACKKRRQPIHRALRKAAERKASELSAELGVAQHAVAAPSIAPSLGATSGEAVDAGVLAADLELDAANAIAAPSVAPSLGATSGEAVDADQAPVLPGSADAIAALGDADDPLEACCAQLAVDYIPPSWASRMPTGGGG